MTKIRLQKAIASAGVTSRRKAEKLIADGHVTVNKRRVTEMGVQVDPQKDKIRVDGKLIKPLRKTIVAMLHKPKGYVCTRSDPQERHTIYELLPPQFSHLNSVGRLDFNSEGLILLTNDGDLANKLAHPRYHLPKIYEVKFKGHLDAAATTRLRDGVMVKGRKTGSAKVKRLRLTDENCWYRITISEGRNRQIRHMGDAVGFRVLKIKRTQIGNIAIGDLPIGAVRSLSGEEFIALKRAVRSTLK